MCSDPVNGCFENVNGYADRFGMLFRYIVAVLFAFLAGSVLEGRLALRSVDFSAHPVSKFPSERGVEIKLGFDNGYF